MSFFWMGSCLLCLVAAGMATGAKKAASVSPAQRLSLEEIDSRISTSQGTLASLGARLQQLRSDSNRIALELSRSSGSLPSRLAQIDADLARKNADLASLKAQRDRARQDSVTQAGSYRGRTAALQNEKNKIDARIVALSAEIDSYNKRNAAVQKSPLSGSGSNGDGLLAESNKTDSLMRARQAELPSLNARKEQLRQDSIREESSLGEIRRRAGLNIRRIDSLLQNNMNAQALQMDKRNKARADSAAVVTRERQKMAALTDQKRQAEQALQKCKVAVTTAENERERLRQAATTAQTKNQAQRTPLLNALTTAETQFQERVGEKDAWQALREKIAIDSALAKAREQLDNLILAAARGDRSAKKQTEAKQDEVGSLLARKDDYIKKPAVMQREANLREMTTAQKRRTVDSLLQVSSAQITALSGQRDRAAAALAYFDRTHSTADPALQAKILQMDSIRGVRETELSATTIRLDSLDRQIGFVQNAMGQTGSSVRSEVNAIDGIVSALNNDRSALTAQLAQARGDSLRTEGDHAESLRKVKGDLAGVAAQIISAEKEVAACQSGKNRLRQLIAAAQDKNRSAQLVADLERRRLDSLIATRQQEIATVTSQSGTVAQDLQGATRQYETTARSASAANSRLDSDLAARNKEISDLYVQRDGVSREKAAADAESSSKTRTVASDILGTNQAIQVAQVTLENLGNQRQQVLDGLKQELAGIDTRIAAESQNLAMLSARRDKARQDSSAAESARRDVAQRASAGLRAFDAQSGALQGQLGALAADLQRAKDDSVRLVQKNAASVSQLQMAVTHSDTMIAMKEREIAALRTQREEARQNVVSELGRQAAGLGDAHREIVNRKTALDQKQGESSVQLAERKKIQQDSARQQQVNVATISVAATEIQRAQSQIEQGSASITALQDQRNQVAAKTGSSAPATTYRPASAAVYAPVSTVVAKPQSAPINASPTMDSDGAQQEVEAIYTLLSDNKNKEASNRFLKNKALLQKFMDTEAFQTLYVTILQTAGGKKK